MDIREITKEELKNCHSLTVGRLREYLDPEKYPKLKGKELKPYTEEQIKESMDQYTPAWCPVKYNDEDDVLFIDLHY